MQGYPLVTIRRVFQNPRKADASTDYAGYNNLKEYMRELTEVENSARAECGAPPVSEASAMSLGEKRGRIQNRMKADPRWKELYLEVVRLSGAMPVVPYENLSEEIGLPDWNTLTASINGFETGNNRVYLDLGVAHSYVTQLHRKGKFMGGSFSPVSVYGNVRNSDGNTMLGERGGMSYAGGEMTMPAGSLYVAEKGGLPVVDPLAGIKKELRDETGLENSRRHGYGFDIKGVIGIFTDPTLVGIVYDVPTLMTEDELLAVWNKKGNKEHESVFFLSQDEMLDYILVNADRRPEIAQKVDPSYPLLPSGVAVMLSHMRRVSKKNFDMTLDYLGGLFATGEDAEGYYFE